uniref:Methionine aminopeptidase n=2 Tax=Thermorudis TaxID=1649508 RepID=A0A7C2WKH3_9BACT
MPVTLKSAREIELMRAAGRIAATVLDELRAVARPGVTTGELDALACERIRELGGRPAFLGYRGYPACICTSVNEQVLHGIPGKRVLRDGDLLSLDVGVEYRGLYVDAAVSLVVGTPSSLAQRLVAAAEGAFRAGLEVAYPGQRLGDLGAAIEAYVRAQGFSVITGYSGHGVGLDLHEEPSVPNTGPAGRGIRLRPGMTLAVEPMLSAGGPETVVADDGWTVSTRDGSLTAHYEHTIWIGSEGPVILTAR